MSLLQDAEWKRDMEREWKDVISKNRPELCKMIDTEADFIDYLEGLKVFNNRTCQSFKSKTGRYNQVSAILTALSKRPFEDFLKFCDALEKSNQGHVIGHCLSLTPQAPVAMTTDPVCVPSSSTQADARPGGGDEADQHPLKDVWRDLIRDNYPALVSEIDPDHGLFTYLVGKKVIMEWMQDTFKVKTGRSNRASAILDHLILKRPFEDFIKFSDALVETKQKHIVDKYFSRGQPSATDQSDVCCMVNVRPHVIDSRQEMSDLMATYGSLRSLDWKATFIETRSSLVESIDASNDFINLLLGLGIFNAISFEACQEREDIFQRTEFILDYMRRRPDEDFLRFCLALFKSNQNHVIDILLLHKIERPVPPSDPPTLPLQPSTRGRGEGGGDGDEMQVKRIYQPVDDSKPAEEMDIELHQPRETGGLEMQRLGQEDEGYVTYQMGHNTLPLAPQLIDAHPMQRVVCQPEDEEEEQGDNNQRVVCPNSVVVGNPLAARETDICGELNQLNCEVIEDNDSGPAEIVSVHVRPCKREFYETQRNRAYPMCRHFRGKCIIINNRIVYGMSVRNGTERDGWLLRELFRQLNFQVEELENMTAEQIKRTMKNFSRDETLRNDQCLVLFVLSHGQTIESPAGLVDCVYGSDGEPVTANEILEPLTDANCPQLRKKPKLVFFQACRGDHYQDQTQTDAPPVFRDFLIGYPTQRDYRSFRNTVVGTWYINAVVQVFARNACDTSLSELMNLVTGKVAAWSTDTGNVAESHQKGQTATYTSHLTKSFYFFPGIVLENDNR